MAAEEPLVTGCALRWTLEEQLLAALSPSFLPICRNAFSQLSGQRCDNQASAPVHGMSTCTPTGMLSCRQAGVSSNSQIRRVSLDALDKADLRPVDTATGPHGDRSTRRLIDIRDISFSPSNTSRPRQVGLSTGFPRDMWLSSLSFALAFP